MIASISASCSHFSDEISLVLINDSTNVMCFPQAFLEGYNSTIFAYGQTGSGKTHTIFGPELPSKSLVSSPTKSPLNKDSNPEIRTMFGLVPRCFITVFERLQSANHIRKHQIGLSCVEVYNVSSISFLNLISVFYSNQSICFYALFTLFYDLYTDSYRNRPHFEIYSNPQTVPTSKSVKISNQNTFSLRN